MLRQTIENLRHMLHMFNSVPPMPRRSLLPGLILIAAYPLLAVLLGNGEQGQAFVTAFLLAMAVRIGVRFEALVDQLLSRFSRRETAATAILVALLPLALLASVDDPLWCQRIQSAYYIVLGSMFLSDMLANRNDLALRFWPMADMRAHLPLMTRVMVLFNLAFLVLNETMIRAVDPSHWLLFWAVLPVIRHVVLTGVILTIVAMEDSKV